MFALSKTSEATLALLILAAMTACGTSRKNNSAMEASPRVPAAEAIVKTKDAGNNNTEINLEVRHLAPVQRIAPDASTYVVWVQPTDGSPAQNVGAIAVDEDLKGHLRTVTPYKAMRIFITPEQLATASYPKGEQVLSTTIQD
jgi:hypothetical protein